MLGSYSVSRAMQCKYNISIPDKLLFVCVYAFICTCGTLYMFPILLPMNRHSEYNTSDGRIAGNRRPYPDIIQRSIKSSRVHELCQTHFVVKALMVDKIYKAFSCFRTFHNALD